MRQYLGLIALLVRDYDEAIAYYAGTLGFELIEDSDLGGGKRWIVVSPPGAAETRLLLARAAGPAQEAQVGAQGGGRVFLFLYSDDFWRDYRALSGRGVVFCEAPRQEPYGIVAVFEDLYGNRWDLLQPAETGVTYPPLVSGKPQLRTRFGKIDGAGSGSSASSQRGKPA